MRERIFLYDSERKETQLAMVILECIDCEPPNDIVLTRVAEVMCEVRPDIGPGVYSTFVGVEEMDIFRLEAVNHTRQSPGCASFYLYYKTKTGDYPFQQIETSASVDIPKHGGDLN